jgi:hypothetical protein
MGDHGMSQFGHLYEEMKEGELKMCLMVLEKDRAKVFYDPRYIDYEIACIKKQLLKFEQHD